MQQNFSQRLVQLMGRIMLLSGVNFKKIITILILLIFTGSLYGEVTVKTGEFKIEYNRLEGSGSTYSEKDELLQNSTITKARIDNFQIYGSLLKNSLKFHSILNLDFNDPESFRFGYSRISFFYYSNTFILGFLQLGLPDVINNTNSIYGFKWEMPVLPENRLQISLFGAKLIEGYDSPYYPSYLYGAKLISEVKKFKFGIFYCDLKEQEEAVRNNSVLQPNFIPTGNSVNKITTKSSVGIISKSISIDMERNPVLEISILDTQDKNLSWQIDVDDGIKRVTLQYITGQSGIFKYNLKSPTGWSGLKNITIYIIFYNTPTDISDNSLYIDYIKIFEQNSLNDIYVWEDLSNWIIPDDVYVTVMNKQEIINSLPDFYFPFSSRIYGISIKKDNGDFKGLVDILLNQTRSTPVELKNGYFIKSKLSYIKKSFKFYADYQRINDEFDIGPLSIFSEPEKDLKDDLYFTIGSTSFFGNWILENVKLVPAGDCVRIIGDGGQIYKYFTVDIDKYPILSIKIGGEPDMDFEWALYIEDDNSSFLATHTAKKGVFSFNIKEITGWSGVKRLKVVIKKGKSDLFLYWIKFWRTEVSKRYEFGENSDFTSLTASYGDKFETVASIKFKNEFNSYNLSIKENVSIVKTSMKKFLLSIGFTKNKGLQSEEIWEYYKPFKYAELNFKLYGFYNLNRFKIQNCEINYDYLPENRFSLFTYNASFKIYALNLWWIYNLKGLKIKVDNEREENLRQDFGVEKEFLLTNGKIVPVIQYIYSIYKNRYFSDFNYQKNVIKLLIVSRSAGIKNLTNQFLIQYEIGKFGDVNISRYNKFEIKMETKLIF